MSPQSSQSISYTEPPREGLTWQPRTQQEESTPEGSQADASEWAPQTRSRPASRLGSEPTSPKSSVDNGPTLVSLLP